MMEETTYFGIDPSLSSTGFYCSNGENKCIETKPGEPTEDRILMIWNILYTEIKKSDFPVVGIEGFSFMSKGRGMAQLFGLGYFIRCMLRLYKIPFYEISPNSWKKFLMRDTLKKGMGKDVIILKTYTRYKIEITNNNICDAYNILKITEKLHKVKLGEIDITTLPQIEKDIFSKLI